MNKILLQGIVVLVMAGYSAFSSAVCYWEGDPVGSKEIVWFENVRVPNSLPVGSVLFRKTYDVGGARLAAWCGTSSLPFVIGWAGFAMSPVVFQGETLYRVGRQGLALRVLTDTPLFPEVAFPRERTFIGGGDGNFLYSEWGQSITFELVKTAPVVVPGIMVLPGHVNPYVVFPGGGRTNGGVEYIFGGPGNVTAGTCAVTSKDVAINLGDISRSAFPAGGGPVPGAIDVASSIDLVCDAGTPAKVTLDGAIASGRPTILSTTSAGVGVELLLKGNPVTYGSKIDLGIIASDGPFKIPLTARYYGMGGAVTRGPLTANATFTFDFL